MNYRHEFHAANFADVFKHIVLVRMIEHFKGKEKAFRVLDTHGGSGQYILPPANQRNHKGKPPEWVDGIGRLLDWKPSRAVSQLIQPYLDIALSEKDEEGALVYPGSPLIAYKAMRNQDRISASELYPPAYESLKAIFAGNYQAKIFNLDGWLIPGSHIPPKEKRGLMLIDPPFEIEGDFWRMAEAVTGASKRWSGGTVALWYPLKHRPEVQGFKNLLMEREVSNLLCLELQIDKPGTIPTLFGCGMLIRNPPFKLQGEMETILRELGPRLAAQPNSASWSIKQLTAE